MKQEKKNMKKRDFYMTERRLQFCPSYQFPIDVVKVRLQNTCNDYTVDYILEIFIFVI